MKTLCAYNVTVSEDAVEAWRNSEGKGSVPKGTGLFI